MIKESVGIEGVWIFQSKINLDSRGYLVEWFKESAASDAMGDSFELKQGNLSKSVKGALRGIHFSLAPEGENKWITCVSGSILDLIIDLRPKSPTFRKWIQIPLTSGDGKAILIDQQLGHAILSLEDNTVVSYLLTSSYSPKNEFVINPFDPDLAIVWPKMEYLLSEKDNSAPMLAEIMNLL